MKKNSGNGGIGNLAEVICYDTAGIDLGANSHWVAVPTERDEQPIREFKCFTSHLHGMAKWLKSCKIKSIAMEATGVYWEPVYSVLEEYGFEVCLVNARHMKNVAGRKTDVVDCQWLQHLHACGLLNASFIPGTTTRAYRAYVRQRKTLIIETGSSVKRLHNQLERMNMQLHKVIRDVTGITGMRILKAIIDGERDPLVLAKLAHPRIKASEEEIIESLRGTWREENLFILRQSVEMVEYYESKIREVDGQIEKLMASFESKIDPSDKPLKKARRNNGNAVHFDFRAKLYEAAGVDLTAIDGLGPINLMTITSETGIDMSPWKTEHHFTSWLCLAPNVKKSGGKVLSSATRKTKNSATTEFRIAAMNILRVDTYLGAVARRLASKLGKPKAITAVARKIAVRYYHALKNGEEYIEKGAKFYEERYRAKTMQYLQKKALQMGCQIVEMPIEERLVS